MIITDFSAICNLGESREEIFTNARDGILYDFKIDTELPEITDENYNLRCNRILLHCVNQLRDKINLLIQNIILTKYQSLTIILYKINIIQVFL